MALPPTEQRQARTLVASAARIGRGSDYAIRRKMPWQKRALEYIDLVPELNYASRFYARMMKQLRIMPVRLSDEGEQDPITDGLPVDLLNRIQDPGGGRSGILGNYGRLMFVTGAGTLFGRELVSEDNGNPADERWSFVWDDEVEVEQDSDGTIRKITWMPNSPSDKREYGPEKAAVYQMWTSHPRRSGEADSPMRAALEIAEELIILTQAVHATAVSRITNGILLMPNEMAPPPAEAIGDEDPLNDPFIQDVADVFEAQVANPGAPSARIPPVIWGANEYLPNIRHVLLHDPQNDYLERDLRKEAVERLARGFDMPVEVLLGLGDSNHWAARQILDDMWKSHGAPIAEHFCDDLNEVYLRPALREAEYEDWENVAIGYDESQVVVKPDRSDDADKALDRLAIGFTGYRVMKNIPESYAPTPEEEDLTLVRLGRNADPAAVDPSMNGKPADQGPPDPGPEGDSGRQTRVVASAAREMGAAEMALMRCRELAGSRIRNKASRCPECVEPAEGQPLVLVASAIGPDRLLGLHLEPTSLVKGGTDPLRPLLATWGYPEAQVNALCQMIEMYAARTIFDERAPSLPSGFAAQVEQMKELMAGAVVHP